jgi:hypothetical protein
MKGHLGKQHSSVTLERRCRLLRLLCNAQTALLRDADDAFSRTQQYAPVRVLAGALHLAPS